MHNSMSYEPIKGQGDKILKVGISEFISSAICNGSWQVAADSKLHNIKILSGRIFDICPSFCIMCLSTWLKIM